MFKKNFNNKKKRTIWQLVFQEHLLKEPRSFASRPIAQAPQLGWLIFHWVCLSGFPTLRVVRRSTSAFTSEERTVQQTGTWCAPNVVWNQSVDHQTEKCRTSDHLRVGKQHRENFCSMKKNILGDSEPTSVEGLWKMSGTQEHWVLSMACITLST